VRSALPNNLLGGTLPASIGNLTALTSLSLKNNYVAGALPPTLARLGALTALDLSDNLLSDTLPVALAPLRAGLSAVNLANNWLELPAAGAALDAALCAAVACSAAAGRSAFVCSASSSVAAACGGACATTAPSCQRSCALASVNASSWGAELAPACSGTMHACDACLPALKAPLLSLTSDVATIMTCLATFTPRFLDLDVSAASLDATALCGGPPGGAGVLGAPCAVSLPSATADAAFVAAAGVCAPAMFTVEGACGVCINALAAPFLEAGVATAAGLASCFNDYGALAAAASVPMLEVAARAPDAVTLPATAATAWHC
jgi:hypothetical protein